MKDNALTERQRDIIAISAFTASGDMENLKKALNEALDNGLTINEIKEILVQLYAYAGFPRSLNGIHACMSVVEERKAKGVKVAEGKLPTPMPENWNRDDYGAKVRAHLAGMKTIPNPAGYQLFAPVIDQFLKEHLFADIFSRDNLAYADRELATIAALASMKGVENQLRFHLGAAKNVGLTSEQLKEFVSVMEELMGKEEAKTAGAVLDAISGGQGKVHDITDVFPRGNANTAYAKYFVGNSYLNPLSKDGVAISNVTFEPGCRNNWHTHQATQGGGQILLCTAGRGWYQEWGKPAQELRAGDVVNIPAGVKHWHGAAKDSWFAHLAVSVPGENAKTDWHEPVDAAEYEKLP